MSALRPRIAYVAHRDGGWGLYVDDRRVPLDGDASSPEWLPDGELVVTVSKGGFAELHRGSTRITRTRGGAFSPAPSPDGRVFFTSLEPDGFVVRVLPAIEEAPAPPAFDAMLVPALPPPPPTATAFVAEDLPEPRSYGVGRQEFGWIGGTNYGPDHRSLEVGVRFGDVVGRLDTLLLASLANDDAPEGFALATAWRGWPVEVHAHGFSTDEEEGAELRGVWSRTFPLSRLTVEAGALSDDLVFGSAAFATRQLRGKWRIEEGVRIDLDDRHYRASVAGAIRSGSFRIGARYQHDAGDTLTLGGLSSSILPRSAYALRVLDPALPVATLTGDEYDGWRVETSVPSMPFTAFYQRHEVGGASLSLAGLTIAISADPFPIMKLPGFDVTAGVARILDDDDTNWWLGMRWRP